MLDQIVVPEETSRKAEEMLYENLVKGNEKEMKKKNKDQKIVYKIEQKNSNWKKVVLSTAAAVVVIIGGVAVFVSSIGKGTPDEYRVGTPVTSSPTAKSSNMPEPSATPNSIYNNLKDGEFVALDLKENEMKLDLDGDGTDETIKLEEQSVKDDNYGKDYTLTVNNQKITGYTDDPERMTIYATALLEDKTKIQLVFTDFYGSDDFETRICGYENGKLELYGMVNGDVTTMKTKGEYFTSYEVSKMFCTFWDDFTYQLVLNTDGKTDSTYSVKQIFDTTYTLNYDATVLQKLSVYKMKGEEEGIAFTVNKGDKLKVVSTDGESWVYVENGDQGGYIEVSGYSIIMDGLKVDVWEVLDGVPFAG